LKDNKKINFFRAATEDFRNIPGSPVSYWVSARVWNIFGNSEIISAYGSPKIGMRTGNNDLYLRYWYEVDKVKIKFPQIEAKDKKWFPYNKGGAFRKWYGNFYFVVNWANSGYEIKLNTLKNYPELSWDNLGWKISNENYYLHEGITWTDMSSSSFGVRYLPKGFIFDASGPCLFTEKINTILAFLTTKQCFEFLRILNPTMHFKNYNISSLPIIIDKNLIEDIEKIATES